MKTFKEYRALETTYIRRHTQFWTKTGNDGDKNNAVKLSIASSGHEHCVNKHAESQQSRKEIASTVSSTRKMFSGDPLNLLYSNCHTFQRTLPKEYKEIAESNWRE
jgi:hypothetical protein